MSSSDSTWQPDAQKCSEALDAIHDIAVKLMGRNTIDKAEVDAALSRIIALARYRDAAIVEGE